MGYKVLFFSLSLAALSSCSKSTSAAPSAAVPVLGTSNSSASTTAVGDAPQRECLIAVRNSNETALTNALSDIAQTRVSQMVTPVTVCIAAPSSPLTGFQASFRIEYEDNIGLHWVTFRSQDLIYSSQTSNSFRIVYLDQYGYTQLNATLSGGQYSGTISEADTTNNTVYQDEINAFLQNIQKTCNSNPSACLDPVFLDPTQTGGTTDILQQIDNAFAGMDNIVPYTLGTVSFDATAISPTLF